MTKALICFKILLGEEGCNALGWSLEGTSARVPELCQTQMAVRLYIKPEVL